MHDTQDQPKKLEVENGNPASQENFFSELFRFALIAVVIVLPIRLFIAQPFIVAGASMEPTFADGEYLIVDEISYRFTEPERGDVIIFRYPRDPSKFFIKRIVALPEEMVEIDNGATRIYNNAHPEGFTLTESYIRTPARNGAQREILGENEYFVLGDNRNASSDSRIWGALPRELIVGRALLRLLPVAEAGVFPGYATPLAEPE